MCIMLLPLHRREQSGCIGREWVWRLQAGKAQVDGEGVGASESLSVCSRGAHELRRSGVNVVVTHSVSHLKCSDSDSQRATGSKL